MMIDGIWWLLIIVAVIAVLWLIASKRGVPTSDKAPKAKPNDALQKVAALIEKAFSHYQVTRRANHLLITKDSQKIVMITMDKKIPAGERRLGDVRVINYHRVPSEGEVKKVLSPT